MNITPIHLLFGLPFIMTHVFTMQNDPTYILSRSKFHTYNFASAKLWSFFNYVHPTEGSAVHQAWFPVISRKSIYPVHTKFGVGVYWVNSLHGIAFGEDNSKAN